MRQTQRPERNIIDENGQCYKYKSTFQSVFYDFYESETKWNEEQRTKEQQQQHHTFLYG